MAGDPLRDGAAQAEAFGRIEEELQERLAQFKAEGKLLEAQRLGCGCSTTWRCAEGGVLQRHRELLAPLDGRSPGEPPIP